VAYSSSLNSAGGYWCRSNSHASRSHSGVMAASPKVSCLPLSFSPLVAFSHPSTESTGDFRLSLLVCQGSRLGGQTELSMSQLLYFNCTPNGLTNDVSNADYFDFSDCDSGPKPVTYVYPLALH